MLDVIFPSLFNLFGADSVNYSDVVVKKSPVNPTNCVIIYARRPIEWFMEHCAKNDIANSVFNNLVIKGNTDGSISVINP